MELDEAKAELDELSIIGAKQRAKILISSELADKWLKENAASVIKEISITKEEVKYRALDKMVDEIIEEWAANHR